MVTYGESLTKHGLGLHGDALDAIDDHQTTVGNTQRGGNLRREIDVTWRIDQIEKKVAVACREDFVVG
jgi:hypothetical protein